MNFKVISIQLWLVLFCHIIKQGDGIIDMNIHELQFIADHLTISECKMLVKALQKNTWELPKNLNRTTANTKKNTTQPLVPCLILLLNYDQNKGRHKTFHDLSHRLHQIGRKDLADKLSRMIFHKKAEDIKKNYLDNPFRKLIDPTPIFVKVITGEGLDERKEEQVPNYDMSKSKESNFWSTIIMMFCVVTVLSLLFMITSLCVTGCPVYIRSFYRNCTPQCLVNCTSRCYNVICNIKDWKTAKSYSQTKSKETNK